MPQAVTAVATAIYVAVGTTAAALGASSATAAALATAAVSTAAAATQVVILAGLNAVVANQNKPRPQGGLINLTINPNEPRRLQIGTRINGGVLADWYIKGSKNQYLYMIVYLGEGPMGRIMKVIGGGREVYSTPIEHGTRTVIPNYRSGGDRLWITYYDGRPGQTADSYLVSQGVGWTSNHVGAGCAYAIVEAWWDSDNQTTPPQISFEMEGAKLYDRRKDTTAGGSGAHRANDPATWELSSNPAVALDHYLLGRYTGSVKTFGVGLAASDVPYAAFAARANLADENVNRKVSGTLKRYAANGFLFADRSYADTIRDLCRAQNARPADFGGRIGIIDGEEKTPVMTLADADVIDGVPESYIPKRSWADLVSVVRGTYQNPAQLYQAGEYPRVTDAAWTAADGGSPKEATLDLEMETDVERAQRLATLFARRERRQAQLTGTYALRTIELEQGDWFIRAGGIFGAGKTFEVIDRVLDARSMTVTITAFEVDPADSAWVPSTAIDAPPAAIANTDTLQAMEVPSLTVTGVTLSGTVADLPAIRVQWTAPDDPRVRQIVVEAVPTAGGVPVAQTVDVGTAQVVFTNGITDDTAYLVRARFIGEYIPSAWTGNVAVTTLGDYSVGTATSVPWSGLTGSIPAAVDNALVPFGVNGLSNSGFVNGAAGWQEGWNGTAGVTIYRSANNAGWRGAVQVAYAYSDATPAAGTVFDVWQRNGSTQALARRNLLPVLPGDKVYASALLAKLNATSISLNIGWYDSALSGLGELGAGSVTADSNPYGGVSANMTRVGGFGTAPANAAFANVWARVQCSGAYNPLGSMSEVMLTRVPSGQTAAVPYSPGSADLLADPTIDNTAAAITGQGAFATVSSAAYGSALLTGFGGLSPLDFTTLGAGGLIRRQDGVTALTDALAVTSLGTAAAIAGQGSFATLSAINDSLANSNNLLRRSAGGLFTGNLAATLGARAGTDIFRTDGVTVLSQAEIRTPEGTAAAIAGQGWGATASEAAASNAQIPNGTNRAAYARYEKAGAWSVANVSGLHTGISVYSIDYLGHKGAKMEAVAPSAGLQIVMQYGGAAAFKIPVVPGERVGVAFEMESQNGTAGGAYLVCFDVFGALQLYAALDTWSGYIAYGTTRGGFATIPANCKEAYIDFYHTSESAGWVSMVILNLRACGVSASQTALPRWSEGRVYDYLADVTATNTAAAITGQGALATLNDLSRTGGRLSGFAALAGEDFVRLGSGGRVRRDDGVTLLTDALAVTSLGTAAAIAGQGPGATAADSAVLNSFAYARDGADGSPIGDWNFTDRNYWGMPTASGFVAGNPLPSALRSIVLGDGTYDYSSEYWDVTPGEEYEITFRWWNGFPGFTGYIRPLLHIPAVVWLSARAVNGVNPDGGAGTQPSDITTGSSAGTDRFVYTIPSTVSRIQMRFIASIGGGVNFYYRLEMKPTRSVVRGADITSANTAAAITGQGWGATAAQFAADNQYPLLRMPSGLARNANFAEPFTGTARPPGWSEWVDGAGTFGPLTGLAGSGYVRTVAPGVVNDGIRQRVSVEAGKKYLLAAEARRSSGSFAPTALYIAWLDSGLSQLSADTWGLATLPTTSGQISATPDGWNRWEIIATAPASAVYADMLAINVASFIGSVSSGTGIEWRLLDLIPLPLVSELRADRTVNNTAAAITGQGALATLNSVATAQIASGAVSTVTAAYTSGTTGGSAVGDGWTRHQSVTLTTAGGALIINAALKGLIASDTSNASQSVRIRRGTNLVYECSPFNQVVSSGDTFAPFSTTITDAPAAGTYTYYLETTFGGADISRNEFSNRALVVTELKR